MDSQGEWLHRALSSAFEIKRWQGVKFSPLGDDAKGYTADILRAHPRWKGIDLPKTVIVKTPNYKGTEAFSGFEKNKGADADLVQAFHRNETYYYSVLTRSYPVPVVLPQVYFGCAGDAEDEVPVIVMEDLGAYKPGDVVDGLNENQLFAVVDELVKLHFYSFTTDEWKKIPPLQFKAKATFPELTRFFGDRLKEQSPIHFGYIDDVFDLLGDGDWHLDYFRGCAEDDNSVIAHGDLWTANLMWEGDILRAIIDWQISHRGSIMEDLLRLLVTGTSVDVRRRLSSRLLSYYCEEMKNIFEDSGRKVPFTHRQIQEEYRRMLLYTAGCTIFAVGMWSNSGVLKDGTENEGRRLKEMYDRLKDLLDETLDYHLTSKKLGGC